MRRDPTLLIVDDDPSIRRTFTDLIGTRYGFRVSEAANGQEGLDQIRRTQVDVVVVDFQMPILSGMDFLKAARRVRPDLQVVMLTGNGSIGLAVEAMKQGAADFLTKPFKLADIQVVLERVRKMGSLEGEVRRLQKELGERYAVEGLMGRSDRMQKVHALVDRVRVENCNVLIEGESGTGKELIARAVHYDGARSSGPFVTLDCGSISDALLESELFGHVQGAFTGADEDKVGLFEHAHGGTLFLDEVGELPLALQPALLRVLEDKKVRPVGGTQNLAADVRIIAATNRDLEKEMEAKRFRRDLFYRLNVIRIPVPPLRLRKEDIPLLAQHFLGNRNITSAAIHQLMRHDWPGNVRELEHVLQSACLLSGNGRIGEGDLTLAPAESPPDGNGRSLRDMEVNQICRLLQQHQGCTARVASILGVNRSTLYRKLRRYKIKLTQFR